MLERIYKRWKNTDTVSRLLLCCFGPLALFALVLLIFVWRGAVLSPSFATDSDLPLNADGSPFNHPVEGYYPVPQYSLFVFFVRHNPDVNFFRLCRLIRIYDDECRAENISLAVAFAQMCHETGFLKFGGSVQPKQNNFAGLGAVSATSPGNTFPDVVTGVRAQIQHLKAYASDQELQRECVDQRFRYVKRKSAQGIFDLAGKWAADPNYGRKLLIYIMEIYSCIPAWIPL
ncbi:MAG: glucosaminidase domain-containing protein [Spirochaetales bacterium]|nr:glucosaminidase domain-containing protein [Spirochaetales bacterium]